MLHKALPQQPTQLTLGDVRAAKLVPVHCEVPNIYSEIAGIAIGPEE
jgi:hypothetical protein